MLYLMSTTVIPHGADGEWRMSTVSAERARLIAAGEHASAVGHESSAAAMSAALRIPVAANRLTVQPEPGDQFLCMRLHSRPPEGVVLDSAQLEQIGYSWALMEYCG
jgi:hypothetical protein